MPPMAPPSPPEQPDVCTEDCFHTSDGDCDDGAPQLAPSPPSFARCSLMSPTTSNLLTRPARVRRWTRL
eukprot:534417-Prymnesium_polylepis.1